mmetsp:Transcript_84857/g.274282  ORF Transcript_84857/g.274282 Transcript_84857/m.274282 type:complete len:548 (+) Transcript_84857:80-1723(+)
MVKLPSHEDRSFVAALNELSKEHSAAAFGDPGRLVIGKARRQLAFASAAWMRWPNLGDGDLRTVPVEDWHMSKVDTACPFWIAGRQQYLDALASYLDALREPELQGELRRELLGELGVHLVEDVLTEEEERELAAYWAPENPVFPFGAIERISGRRWFNYGPVLPRATQGTTKSTLTVIPTKLGAMPPVVRRQRLQERIRAHATHLVGVRKHTAFMQQYEFDQMYVNYYDAASRSNINFHHDSHACQMGTIAGFSLLSACELQLRALDGGITRPPLRIRLPRRSLYFLSGLSRWHLQHGIPEMLETRVSLTFRTVDRACTREQALWEQTWDLLEAEEAQNAVWPLVLPDGEELHHLVSSPEEIGCGVFRLASCSAASTAFVGATNSVTRVPRPSTVVAGTVGGTTATLAVESFGADADITGLSFAEPLANGGGTLRARAAIGASIGSPSVVAAVSGSGLEASSCALQGFYPPSSTARHTPPLGSVSAAAAVIPSALAEPPSRDVPALAMPATACAGDVSGSRAESGRSGCSYYAAAARARGEVRSMS